MGSVCHRSDHYNRGFGSALLPVLNLPEPSRLKTTPPNKNGLTRKSLLILQVLRQNARQRRNKDSQTFYSIRAVANHFGVPPTTVSRIYRQLRSEGLLTTVWGSKTFITPTRMNSDLRIRGVVALPASLTSFCMLREYRNFCLEMRDALWRFGFAAQLLFHEQSDAQLSTFTQRLLKHKLDLTIWFLPTAKSKETIARLLDRGIRVISISDSARDCREDLYSVDRGPAIRDALLNWRKNGIRSVTVLQNSDRATLGKTTLVEKCLRDTAMPYALVNPEALHTFATSGHRISDGIIFPSSQLTIALPARDPARFAKLSERSRILLVEGLIEVPGLYGVSSSSDVVEVDAHPIAKRIVSDLIQSTRRRNTEPVSFQAKWIATDGAFA